MSNSKPLFQPAFQPTDPRIFFSKNDPQDIRLGDIFRPADPQVTGTVSGVGLCGYADDEGIRLNGGRPGAVEAPPRIRQFLFKMTPPRKPEFACHDFGDLSGTIDDLPGRHLAAEELMGRMQAAGLRTLSFGGGHDYGYPDAAAFLQTWIGRTPHKPLVLNFDAHLDVRPDTKGAHSGTPFYRLLRKFSGQFHFAEIGLQPQCNSPVHREWAQAQGACLFDLRDLPAGDPAGLLQDPFFAGLPAQTPVFVSFDIDSLCAAEAPGCSQSWTTGLRFRDCLPFLRGLQNTTNVRGLGIYEVSPPLDSGDLTSKAAALLAYYFLFPEAL